MGDINITHRHTQNKQVEIQFKVKTKQTNKRSNSPKRACSQPEHDIH